MFVVPFLFAPVGYAFHAYRQTQFEYPLVKNIWFLEERLSRGTTEYNEALAKLPGSQIKSDLVPLIKKKGIREDLIIVEQHNLGICSAIGTNGFRKGDAAILVTPKFENADREACHFLVKHEIGHIYKNDTFAIPLVSSICSTAAAIFVTCYGMPVITSVLITIAVAIIAQSLFSLYREGKADDFAIENSTPEELLGARRLFLALKEVYRNRRTSFSKRLLISADGENRADIIHPSLTRRIKKIENVLTLRSIHINPEVEKRRMEELTKFLMEMLKTVEGYLEKKGCCDIMKAQMRS